MSLKRKEEKAGGVRTRERVPHEGVNVECNTLALN
jgi:hypothetical protein